MTSCVIQVEWMNGVRESWRVDRILYEDGTLNLFQTQKIGGSPELVLVIPLNNIRKITYS